MRSFVVMALASMSLALAGCVSTTVMPLAADTVQIKSVSGSGCNELGVQRAALNRAAVETIRKGFDRFIVLEAKADSEDRIVGYGPTTSQTTVKNNKVTTTHTGGGPIVSAKHTQLLTVKMFKEADPAGANALSARAHLGDKWEEIVKENSQKCG